MDTVSAKRRSEIMALVKSKGTRPEVAVRKMVFGMGYRYRLNRSELPGKPDLVFPGRKKVIFVHGCFWHRHEGCPNARIPKSRVEFWKRKLERNAQRDREVQVELERMGWEYLIIWECELKDMEAIASRVKSFLERPRE